MLVACLSKAISRSSCIIPFPLSVTLIYEIPPFLISTVIAVAPASIEFSITSFTTDAGLSITSPAAILFIVESSNKTIFPIVYPFFKVQFNCNYFCNLITLFHSSIFIVDYIINSIFLYSLFSISFNVFSNFLVTHIFSLNNIYHTKDLEIIIFLKEVIIMGNCGCNSELLWFIILFLLLFCCGCGCGCNRSSCC